MSNYEAHMAAVRRERETEQRIRQMDAPDIVEEIHGLEDALRELEAENRLYSESLANATQEIERLREALEQIVNCTPANQPDEWPHHYHYLFVARAALEGK